MNFDYDVINIGAKNSMNNGYDIINNGAINSTLDFFGFFTMLPSNINIMNLVVENIENMVSSHKTPHWTPPLPLFRDLNSKSVA